MIRSTLFSLAFIAPLGLAACNSPETVGSAEPASDPGGWRLVSGKVPTKAEFGALAATCEVKGDAFDSCLAELGLKRAP